MKVLLLGEFSSLHRYLKEGLLELGVDVKLYANGDSWKKISGADGPLFPQDGGNALKRYYSYYVKAFDTAKNFKGYDVVQTVSARIYPMLINNRLLNKIAKQNDCFALASAGDDLALYDAYKNGKFEYYLFDYDKEALSQFDPSTFKGKMRRKTDKKIVKLSDVIVPSLYDYSVGYRGEERLSKVIPFPINTDAIEYKENKLSEKVVFFHGLNRELSKGTPIIRAALERLKNDYPNDVEVIIDGHMPFDRYVEVMNRSNVVIDQCCTYAYGINACIAMAQGKVVMAGNRAETREAFGIESSPIVHIQPNEDQIYDQLVKILESKKDIPEIGYRSRKYVEDVHHYVKNAQKYVDVWSRAGENKK